jgi:PhnB protein
MKINSIQPYLFFDGRCEEAIEFYRKTLDAEVTMLLRFKDSPEAHKSGCQPPVGSENKIMHASLQIGASTLLVSDGRCGGNPKFEGFSLSLTVPNEAEAERQFKALSEGGTVEMPLGNTFFSPSFGVVTDRFDVSWMVYVLPAS